MPISMPRSYKLVPRRALPAAILVVAALLTACSSGQKKPQPAELPPVAALMGTQLAWSAQMGPGNASLAPLFAAGRVFVASNAGTVAALDAATGKDVWRVGLDTPIAAGVGSDGQTAAVITRNNQLVAMADGRELWRARLPARSFTSPLVAGQRVFVLTADRTVTAFDGKTGARLWSQNRPAEPLVLSQTGALLAVGDTLVAGLSGRLVGLNPDNGAVRWEVPVATSRGTNEVERLVDVVAGASRLGNSVCVRSFQTSVVCLDGLNGRAVWSRSAQGHQGVDGDDQLLWGVESDGKVLAWQRQTGTPVWTLESLRFRGLSMPLAWSRALVLGDQDGWVHFLSKQDGQTLARAATDGTAIVGKPVWTGQTWVVVTRTGGVFGFRPE